MLTWILGIAAAVGVTGLIVLALVAPAVASVIAQAVLSIIQWLLKTRFGVGLLTAAACLTFGYFYFDYVGAHRVRLQWREANATATAKANAADAAAAAKAAAADHRNAIAERDTDKKASEDRDAYIADLETRAASVCIDTDADIRRLFNKR